MRPLKLTMSAFGPYKDKEVLDMSLLGDKGIYLITGNTGAGKTTIFDSISFALFGEPSGDTRNPKNFRSKYADDSTETYVELEFVHQGEKYVVKRIPEYMRPKKKGDGFVSQASDAVLTYPDGRIVSKVRDVNRAIETLLGVDRKQFSEIAMIAQGDFMKLITATTPERQAIFRKLFHTAAFDRLKESIREDYSKKNREFRAEQDKISDYISDLRTADDDVNRTRLDNLMATEGYSSDVLMLLETIVTECKERLDELTISLSKAEEQEGKLIKEIETAKDINGAIIDLEDTDRLIKTSSEALKEVETREAKALARQDESAKMVSEIALLEESIKVFDEIEKKNTMLGAERVAHENTKAKLDAVIKRIEGIVADAEAIKTERKSLENSGAECAKLEAELQDIARVLDSMDRLRDEIDEYNKSEVEREKGRTQLVAFADVEKKSNETYENAYRTFLLEQAGIMAEHLEEGQPCPVCGATTHPHLATKSTKAPTEAELESMKKSHEVAKERLETKSNLLAGLQAQNLKMYEHIDRLAHDILGDIDIDNLASILDNRTKECNATKLNKETLLKAERDKIRRQNELERLIADAEKSLEQAKANEVEFEKKYASETANIEQYIEQIKALETSLSSASEESIRARIAECRRIKTEIESDITRAQQDKVALSNKVSTLKGKADELRRKTDGKSPIDIEKLKFELDGITKGKIEVKTARDKALAEYNINDNIMTKVKDESEQEASLIEELTWLKPIYDTAQGTVTGKDKIALETYVQMAYFDRIIERANIRFMQMSDGQYELVRKVEGDNLSSQSGLDLNVIDHYDGSERSAKTLSGGETFKASLSLALGLSDEVQSVAGGIQLDTMFIDEGFGGLDEQSLKNAIDTLLAISESNKLVGIISHVAELKERIDNQIVVKKQGAMGSHVTIDISY